MNMALTQPELTVETATCN